MHIIQSKIKNSRLRKDGFTLVELLVVIAIIAILSVTAFTSLGGETVKARDAKRKQDLSLIQNAMEIIYINEGTYPATLTIADIDKKYLSDIPTDPRGDDYKYVRSGATYLLVSTLENDGAPANYSQYTVGNAEGDLFVGGSGFTGSTCDGTPSTCDLDSGGDCVPYCP